MPGASRGKWSKEDTHAQLTRQCLHCARLQGAGRGPHRQYCMKGSDLGLHSTGVCLSFCLILLSIIIIVSSFSISSVTTLEITCQNIMIYLFTTSSLFIFSLLRSHFLVKTKYLCTKYFPRALVFWNEDGNRMDQVADSFTQTCVDVFRPFKLFLFWSLMEAELISQHIAMAGCFYCMHKPPTLVSHWL